MAVPERFPIPQSGLVKRRLWTATTFAFEAWVRTRVTAQF